MTILIDIDHETGDLTQYTSTVTDGGDLSVAAGAALAGTIYGLNCLIDDTNNIYGQYLLGSADTSGTWRFRFYLDQNSLTMAANNVFNIIAIWRTAAIISFTVELFYTGAAYQVRARLANDAGLYTSTAYYTITDAPHYIEIKYIKSTGPGANNGSAQLWIDGVDKETISGVDNDIYAANFSYIQIGAVAGIDAGTSGTFYMDELIVNNDGSEIGPVITRTINLLAGKMDLRGKL